MTISWMNFSEKDFLVIAWPAVLRIVTIFFFCKCIISVEWNTYRFVKLSVDRLIGLEGRVFANCPGDRGSIPGCVIPKTFKMVLDTSLLNTQQYKVHIKGKVEQSRERSSALPYASV